MERFFPLIKILNFGNPIRHDILNKKIDRNKSLKYFNLNPENKTIGILGGSLGAKEINDLVLKLLPYFKEQKIQVIWQFGKRYIDKTCLVNEQEIALQISKTLKDEKIIVEGAAAVAIASFVKMRKDIRDLKNISPIDLNFLRGEK